MTNKTRNNRLKLILKRLNITDHKGKLKVSVQYYVGGRVSVASIRPLTVEELATIKAEIPEVEYRVEVALLPKGKSKEYALIQLYTSKVSSNTTVPHYLSLNAKVAR